MNYTVISQNPKQFLALTTLKVSEFEYLLEHFTPQWEKYYRYHTLEGKNENIPEEKNMAIPVLKVQLKSYSFY